MSKFGELIETQVPVLFDFYTDWDEASKEMHPVLRDVAAALGEFIDFQHLSKGGLSLTDRNRALLVPRTL